MAGVEKGGPLPKFGDWDVNDPSSGDGFTVIFNKARDEKKTGGNITDSPSTNPDPTPVSDGFKNTTTASLKHPQSPMNWFCCMHTPQADA
ncbi:protein NOI4 isoform X2 [Rutidosis leptorrhynchoides]|uniref:protein NOI4 isoform X2 n=1 Tax=Rutidosis leptorrhynchoides TaxID=125765 RepID=UPI003A99D21B